MAKNEDGKSKLTVTLDVSGMSSTAAIVEQDVEIPMRRQLWSMSDGRCSLPLPLILKMTLPLSVWIEDSRGKKEKKYHSKQRSLVLRIPAA